MSRFAIATLLSLFTISYGYEIQPRILNGIKSNPRDFPFYVYFEFGSKMCGGSLLNDRWVITAAHCIDRSTKVTAYFGLNEHGVFADMRAIPAEDRYVHPGFSEFNEMSVNDIALIKLRHPLRLDHQIRAAKLPADCQSMKNGNEPVIVAGAGYYSTQGHDPNQLTVTLRHAKFTTITSTACRNLTKLSNTHQLICLSVGNNQSAYDGDSGGPLIHAKDGTLIGVMNFVHEVPDDTITEPRQKCLGQGFANIRYHYKWIAQVTGLKLPKCRRTPHDEFEFRFKNIAFRLRQQAKSGRD